jgi:hypothetical protein
MTIPSALIEACERNEFVWHREDPSQIDAAFSDLELPKGGQLFEFAKRYCLQFVSETLPFQLMDIVEDDGISDNVFYAREELEIDPSLLPISAYEAESIYVVDSASNEVKYLTFDEEIDEWSEQVVGSDFYSFMLQHL